MQNKQIILNNQGLVKMVFFLLLLSICIFSGYKIFPLYYNFYELKGLMHAQAYKASVFTDQEIRKNVFTKIQKLKIPIDDPSQIIINRVNGEMFIRYEYEEDFDVSYEDYYYLIYTFKFLATESAEIPEKKNN